VRVPLYGYRSCVYAIIRPHYITDNYRSSVRNESTSATNGEGIVPNESTPQNSSAITSVPDESTMDQRLMVPEESTSPGVAAPNESTQDTCSLDRSPRER
jgi:hypothetical protein